MRPKADQTQSGIKRAMTAGGGLVAAKATNMGVMTSRLNKAAMIDASGKPHVINAYELTAIPNVLKSRRAPHPVRDSSSARAAKNRKPYPDDKAILPWMIDPPSNKHAADKDDRKDQCRHRMQFQNFRCGSGMLRSTSK